MALGLTDNVIGELIIATSSRSATSGGDGYIHGFRTLKSSDCGNLSIVINSEAVGWRRTEENTSSTSETRAGDSNRCSCGG